MEKSISGKIEEKILKIVGAKKLYEHPQYLAMCKFRNARKVRKPAGQIFFWQKRHIGKFYYFEHKGKTKKLLLYFHGGAFVSGPIYFHWQYLKKLSKKTQTSIVFPIYPKAPNYNFNTSYNYLFQMYNEILIKYAGYEISFMGDSAGGNIALSFAEQLKQRNLPTPKNIILFSPCLDLTLSNAEIEKLEKDNIDPMLSVKGLKLMYQAWAGQEDLKNPALSPFFGDFENIGKIFIVVGTDEILFPESKAFYILAKQKNADITLFVKDKMHHAFPLYPIKESKQVFLMVREILK